MSAESPPNPPPAGGYGASGPRAGFGPVQATGHPPVPPPPKGSRALVIVLVILGVVVLMFGTLAVLGALSFRRFVGASKQAEVKNCLGQIAKDSASAYEREAVDQEEIVRRVCPSASRPVPADASLISGKKYQSTPADWQVDKARDAGFACLRFEMTAPQYYQYRYEATPTSFVAGGRGDLNGNGKYSDFTIKGEVKDTRLLLAPSIDETDPDE